MGSSTTSRVPGRKDSKRDGRHLRSERSRRACAEAMLELIREGEPQPTAAAVAGRAGVSLRLVFHHFKDMETLMRHALELQASRIAPLLPVPIAPDAPLDERLRLFVTRRAALYDEVSPVRRAARRLEDRSPTIAEGLGRMRMLMREQLLFVFGRELSGAPASLVHGAQALSSWLAWESMRRHQGLTTPEAEAALEGGLRALLSAAL